MQHKDVHQRLTDRRDQMLGRMMIRRYSASPERRRRYPFDDRATPSLRHISQRLSSTVGKLLGRLSQRIHPGEIMPAARKHILK